MIARVVFYFLYVTDIADKCAIHLDTCNASTYNLLSNLTALISPTDYSYTDLFAFMSEYHMSIPNPIVERFKVINETIHTAKQLLSLFSFK